MTVARTTEISAVSPESFEAAINVGLERAQRILRQVREVWVKDQSIELDENGNVAGYRVRLVITFVLE